MGFSTGDGRGLHPRYTKPAATPEEDQRQESSRRSEWPDHTLECSYTDVSQNNANEGPAFTQQNITTEADLVDWLHLVFPLMTNDDVAKILLYYPSSNASDNANAEEYATLGYTGATALNVSSVATGQQQRANNIYAETTFVCPSYWMAEAFTDKGRSSYKYQYSVPAAQHGADVTGYFGPAAPTQGPDFVHAFMST